jgi:hypothetical protein
MIWTATNLLIEIAGGLVGGLAILATFKDHAFGAIGHAVTGAIGGLLSGYFLQTVVATLVDSTGTVNADPDPVTRWLLQGIGGLAAGAILTMAVTVLKHGIDSRAKTGKRP